MHAFPRHLSIETEMDETERRQTEAVVAAAADCGEQTKLQVVVTRRLQPCGIIWIFLATPTCLLQVVLSIEPSTTIFVKIGYFP